MLPAADHESAAVADSCPKVVRMENAAGDRAPRGQAQRHEMAPVSPDWQPTRSVRWDPAPGRWPQPTQTRYGREPERRGRPRAEQRPSFVQNGLTVARLSPCTAWGGVECGYGLTDLLRLVGHGLAGVSGAQVQPASTNMANRLSTIRWELSCNSKTNQYQYRCPDPAELLRLSRVRQARRLSHEMWQEDAHHGVA